MLLDQDWHKTTRTSAAMAGKPWCVGVHYSYLRYNLIIQGAGLKNKLIVAIAVHNKSLHSSY